ncbi:glycoside hydrolase superfamily [Panaeolus papilionaceus]|nr:glycoside hydrolase superfamily [Panaeolus papilionaceus]
MSIRKLLFQCFWLGPAVLRAVTGIHDTGSYGKQLPLSFPPGPYPALDASSAESQKQSSKINVLHESESTWNSEPCDDWDGVPLVMAYYPEWVLDSFPPSKIDFERITWVDFAFVVPTEDSVVAFDSDDGPNALKQLVMAAHANGAKVKASIGGWSGSQYFSSAVQDEVNRSTFIASILSLYHDFGLDGIDIDWEYPGQKGMETNKVDNLDTSNFLLFLKSLRKALPPSAKISLAGQTTPFADVDGNPSRDVSEFTDVVDWVLLMNYDVWGSSSNPGPNAPFYDACGNSTQPEASAVSAILAWMEAGFPACKLVLGLPSYGYASKSRHQQLRTRSSKENRVKAVKVVGEEDSDGQVQFRSLIDQGALTRTASNVSNLGDEQCLFVGAGGFRTLWDPCSQTPFLTSTESKQIITYDDPLSLSMKATFAKVMELRGVNLFDVHGDTPEWDLVDAIRAALIPV